MTKRFNNDQSRWLLRTPEWPENPKEVPSLFSGRKRLRKLRVLVDAELIAAASPGTRLDKPTMLLTLLRSSMVEFFRYTNGLPPSEVQPLDLSSLGPPYPVYDGWVVAYPPEPERGHWPVTYHTGPVESFVLGGVPSFEVERARADESSPVYTELDSDQRAERRTMDQLALQVASRVLSADIFVTHRPYLHAGSKVVSAPNVTVCTLDGAIPLVALYFRAQHEFVLPTHAAIGTFRFQRGLYFWVGARELLPEAWRWFAACAQHSAASGDEKLLLLGGSLLSRISRALQERDEVQIALNQPPGSDSFDEALGRLDNVLISLMGAIDACARVAHVILKVSGRERTAAWQNDDWLRRVEASEPRLSAVVGPGTPGAHTITVLSKLRNSVHGVALQGTTLLKDGKMEALVGLPEEDEALILDAMDSMGGRASWGFRPIGVGRSHVEPAVLVDRLFAETIALLNRLMQETPVERLPDVTITPDMSQPPVEDPAKGTLDTFSEWNRLAIRWQLGF